MINPFKISLALLERQKKIQLQGELPVAFLDVQDSDMMQFPGPVVYDVEASATVGGTVVRGSISMPIAFQCGRCLQEFTRPLEAEVCHFYDKSDDAELDMSGDIREDILLEVPMNPVCEDDCAGLCLECGAELNHDSCKCSPSSGGSLAWSELDKLDLPDRNKGPRA
jgi:uncharacterized protein